MRNDGVSVQSGLREARQRAGLSQQQLAEAAGVTRQTVAGVEAGLYGPSAAVALRLAAAMGVRVEDIFWLAEDPVVRADWAAAGQAAPPEMPPTERAVRVRMARVGQRWLAWPLSAGGRLLAADGLLEPPPGTSNPAAAARPSSRAALRPGRRAAAVQAQASTGESSDGEVLVRLLRPRGVLRSTVVIAGCEPAIELLAQHAFIGAAARVGRALWWELPNRSAIAAVREGRAHVAAVHGVESPGSVFDLGLDEPLAPPPGHRVFHLVRCRHGWLFDKRIAFHGAADLADGRLRVCNRQPGSGARALLDRALSAAGVDPARVTGYRNVAGGHLELAAGIAAGRAEVGVGVESAAMAHGLGFLPLQVERCDLWVPAPYCELPAVAELLGALAGGGFRADLSAVAPYDTAETGRERTPRGEGLAPRP